MKLSRRGLFGFLSGTVAAAAGVKASAPPYAPAVQGPTTKRYQTGLVMAALPAHTHTLTTAELPSHAHTFTTTGTGASVMYSSGLGGHAVVMRDGMWHPVS